MAVSISEVLQKVGRPLVHASDQSSLKSLSQLIMFADLDAVVLIDSENRAVGVATEKTIIRHIARGVPTVALEPFSTSLSEEVECCSASDDLGDVVARMLREDRSVLLVEECGQLSATISLDRLAELAIR